MGKARIGVAHECSPFEGLFEGFFGHAPIDKTGGNLTLNALRHQIWPHFGFHNPHIGRREGFKKSIEQRV